MRICIFAERLRLPFDEGIKNYTAQLIGHLARQQEVLALTSFGQDIPSLAVTNVPGNPLLLSTPLWRRLARFAPHVVLYVPTACATLFSFARSRVLRAYAHGAPVVLIALQVREYGTLSRAGMPLLCPDLVMVQSEATRASLAHLPCLLRQLSPSVDLSRFRPVSSQQRLEIRRRYGLPLKARILLHVGHLNRGRNIAALGDLQGEQGQQVVIVGSTSTPQEETLVQSLREKGVRVIDEYVADIAELYQAVDCYLFPVQNDTSAIDMPLSVLEALACNLPVVATRFGALSEFTEEQDVYLLDDVGFFQQAIDRACRQPATGRRWAESYGWDQTAAALVDEIRALFANRMEESESDCDFI